MKKLRKKLARFAIFFVVMLFVAATVALSIALYLKDQDYEDLKEDYGELQQATQFDIEEGEREISEYVEEIENLQEQIAELETQKEDLEGDIQLLNIENYGRITGSVAPVINQDGTFSKYQQVCAVSTNNTKLLYCATTSTANKIYSLIVPEGKYRVFASPVNDETGNPNLSIRAYYTEYIMCIQDENIEGCSDDLSKGLIEVEVESQEKVENVDPIDWRIEE